MPYPCRNSLKPSPSRRILFAAATLCLLTSTLTFAKPGLVTASNGNTYQGDVTEKDGMVLVKDKRGIETRLKRETVSTIEYLEDVEFEYDRRHKQLAAGDVPGRIALARYCLNQKRPDLARAVLVEALTLDPNDRDASALYDVAKGQIEIERRGAAREANPPPPREPKARSSATDGGAESPATQPSDSSEEASSAPLLLTPDQINRIRQVEIRQGETGMTFKFENAVEKRFAQKNMMNVGAINALTPYQRFILLRDQKEWGLLKDVKLNRDPQVLATFRQTINPVLLAGCAASGCHGSGGGLLPGSDRPFQLRTTGDKEARDYTNFYLLATGAYQPTPGGPVVPMIDRVRPQQSLLLQYGLRAPKAMYPHPPVKGYQGLFESVDDPKYQLIYRWIRDGLTPQPAPELPNYLIVLGQPTTRPVTTAPSATTMAAASPAAAPPAELPPPSATEAGTGGAAARPPTTLPSAGGR